MRKKKLKQEENIKIWLQNKSIASKIKQTNFFNQISRTAHCHSNNHVFGKLGRNYFASIPKNYIMVVF